MTTSQTYNIIIFILVLVIAVLIGVILFNGLSAAPAQSDVASDRQNTNYSPQDEEVLFSDFERCYSTGGVVDDTTSPKSCTATDGHIYYGDFSDIDGRYREGYPEI